MTENRDDVDVLRAEIAELKTQQQRKSGIGNGVIWTLVIVLLLAITFVLITIYDHVSGNFDERNYGAPASVIQVR